jgi:two-component system response regulator AdeR
MPNGTPTVLIVDDEEDVADAYAAQLADDYDSRVAYSGGEALETYSDDIDVVLLDRRMPGLSGDEVLERIRDMGGDARVAMVTAVDPDFEVIGMGFDDYVVKPVGRDDLKATIENMLGLETYESEVRIYFSLVTKRAHLEAQKSTEELEASDAYGRLTEEIADLESELDEVIEELTMEDYARALRDL